MKAEDINQNIRDSTDNTAPEIPILKRHDVEIVSTDLVEGSM